jgi:cell division septation protein DedD
MLPEGASPILKVDGESARDALAARKPSGKGGARLFGAVFAFAAIVGFGSLIAYYFVQNRDGNLDPANIPVVRADPRPMKIKPENPGGIDVPFQNTEIYDRVGQQTGGVAPVRPPAAGSVPPAGPGERLLPGPEAPMPRPLPPPAPVAAIPVVPEIVAPPDAVVVTPAPPPAAVPTPAAAPPAPAPATPPATAARPAPAAPPASAATAPAGPGPRIQLASVREMADAQREWARVTRQYSDLLGGLSPQFVPADLGDRGVFIRVQAGPFASPEAARAACDALRARGAGCNVVR